MWLLVALTTTSFLHKPTASSSRGRAQRPFRGDVTTDPAIPTLKTTVSSSRQSATTISMTRAAVEMCERPIPSLSDVVPAGRLLTGAGLWPHTGQRAPHASPPGYAYAAACGTAFRHFALIAMAFRHAARAQCSSPNFFPVRNRRQVFEVVWHFRHTSDSSPVLPTPCLCGHGAVRKGAQVRRGRVWLWYSANAGRDPPPGPPRGSGTTARDPPPSSDVSTPGPWALGHRCNA